MSTICHFCDRPRKPRPLISIQHQHILKHTWNHERWLMRFIRVVGLGITTCSFSWHDLGKLLFCFHITTHDSMMIPLDDESYRGFPMQTTFFLIPFMHFWKSSFMIKSFAVLSRMSWLTITQTTAYRTFSPDAWAYWYVPMSLCFGTEFSYPYPSMMIRQNKDKHMSELWRRWHLSCLIFAPLHPVTWPLCLAIC